jgi:hypothetical protein
MMAVMWLSRDDGGHHLALVMMAVVMVLSR